MAFDAKRSLDRRRYWLLQGGVALAILLPLRLPVVRHALRVVRPELMTHNPTIGVLGAALCVAGVGLAIWARMILGRNWGNSMTRKENPELVTAGPYAVIRHPIYTGILLAVLGSAIGCSPSLLVLVPLIVGYYLYSAWQEEKWMLQQFPAQYPAYRKHTGMLLPFIG